MHSFSCPKCDYKSITGHGLIVHMKDHKTVQYMISDKNHVREHTGEKLIECAVCSLKYATASDLQTNIDTTHNISCDQCNVISDTTDNLAIHMKVHYVRSTSILPMPFTCM